MSLLLLFRGAGGAPPVVGTIGTVTIAVTAPTARLTIAAPTCTIEVTPTMTLYLISTTVRVTATFKNLAGTNADPTSVVCTVKDPGGATTTPSVTPGATGIYYADITLDEVGTWYVEWQGTGALVVAGDTALTVRSTYVDSA